MSIGSLVPDTDQAPGFCSSSSVRPLTAGQISRVMTAVNGGPKGITLFSEKDLVGKGTRQLCMLQLGDKYTLVEYVGVRKAKFVSKDAERFEVNRCVICVQVYVLYAIKHFSSKTSIYIWFKRPWSKEQLASWKMLRKLMFQK